MTVALLYTTLASQTEAESIGNTLLDEGLVACANIIPGMVSLYRWQGEKERADEVILLLKTTLNNAERAETRLTELHPYDCPCILRLEADHAAEGFARWVAENTR